MPAGPRPFIRPYRSDDRDAVYEVCVRTGDAGGDATGKYRNDDLLPDIFAGPYLYLEPELAFVLDDRGRAVGYVLGTADTARFVSRYRSDWLPTLAGRYREPVGPPVSPEEQFVAQLYHPERMLLDQLACYPAHLHIDLLPDYQRSGFGRGLIRAFLDALAQEGARGVHLVVAGSNTGAHEFYRRVGFEEFQVAGPPGSALYFGRAVDQPAT
jgi:ribosomal protein S18 acetylase RimI-like enzyme